jgi:thiamine monophosphate synthase
MKTGKVDFRLYLITDRKLTADRCSLTAAVEKALKGGSF